jgi:hypothetical protein
VKSISASSLRRIANYVDSIYESIANDELLILVYIRVRSTAFGTMQLLLTTIITKGLAISAVCTRPFCWICLARTTQTFHRPFFEASELLRGRFVCLLCRRCVWCYYVHAEQLRRQLALSVKHINNSFVY